MFFCFFFLRWVRVKRCWWGSNFLPLEVAMFIGWTKMAEGVLECNVTTIEAASRLHVSTPWKETHTHDSSYWTWHLHTHFCSPLSILTPQVTTNLYLNDQPDFPPPFCQFQFLYPLFFSGRFCWRFVDLKSWMITSPCPSRPCGCAANARPLGSTARGRSWNGNPTSFVPTPRMLGLDGKESRWLDLYIPTWTTWMCQEFGKKMVCTWMDFNLTYFKMEYFRVYTHWLTDPLHVY